jgi:uncharacterized protein YaeQ
MALTATIFKTELQIADMDRGHYADYSLTLARHPSETDERMMVRLLAFALNASDDLQFTKGVCADDEPQLWERSLSDEILLWIEVGMPDERRLRKACNRARRVVLYAYGGRTAEQWWERTAPELRRFDNLQVFNLPQEATRALTGLVSRSMQLQCTVQEGQVWLGNAETTVLIEPQRWMGGE